MIDSVAHKSAEIAELCRRHKIIRLELFGSAASGAFRPETSDLDFVVDLGVYDARVADRLLDFADDLERLLGRRVDLITQRSITNPYFKQSVEASREIVYAAQNSEAAA